MDRESLPIVTIFGASGFIGTQIVQGLARKGYRIRAAVRRPDLALHLRPLGDVGQVVPIQANVRYPDSIARAVAGAGVVINLVGIGLERGGQRFETVHVEGARAVAQAAAAAGAATLVHMSAIGANAESPSAYMRSKAGGEEAVLEAFPQAVIIRPSLVFGPGDEFFNGIASLARLSPVLPLIGGKTRFQPIYVGDTADAFAAAAAGAVKGGKVYEIGGPEVVTMRELMERLLKVTHRRNPLIPLPNGIARAMATVMSILPGAQLTTDRVALLNIENVVSQSALKGKRSLAAFGVTPTPMDAILESYLWRFRPHGQFDSQPAEG